MITHSRRTLVQALKRAKLPLLSERPGTLVSFCEVSDCYLALLIAGVDHAHVGTDEWQMIIIEAGRVRVDQEVFDG